jgi:hypothetical protein
MSTIRIRHVVECRIGPPEDGVDACHPELGRKVIQRQGLPQNDAVELHPVLLRGGLGLLHDRIGSHPERDHTDPGCPWRYLLEELELFADQVGHQQRRPGHVSARLREARHKPGAHWIGDRSHHDRNTRRCASRRAGCIRSKRDDDINLLLDELRRERSELIALPRRVAMLEVHILTFVPAQIAQPLAHGSNAAAAEFWREETERPQPGHLPRLLRAGGERRGEDAYGHQ